MRRKLPDGQRSYRIRLSSERRLNFRRTLNVEASQTGSNIQMSCKFLITQLMSERPVGIFVYSSRMQINSLPVFP